MGTLSMEVYQNFKKTFPYVSNMTLGNSLVTEWKAPYGCVWIEKFHSTPSEYELKDLLIPSCNAMACVWQVKGGENDKKWATNISPHVTRSPHYYSVLVFPDPWEAAQYVNKCLDFGNLRKVDTAYLEEMIRDWNSNAAKEEAKEALEAYVGNENTAIDENVIRRNFEFRQEPLYANTLTGELYMMFLICLNALKLDIGGYFRKKANIDKALDKFISSMEYHLARFKAARAGQDPEGGVEL